MFPSVTMPESSTLQIQQHKKSFDTLQVGRAAAAIAVVFFHAHVFFIPERLYPGETISRVFNIGYSGVEFFFVLSGFIMILVHRADIGVPARARRFLRKRLVRIVPFYWVVTLALALLLLTQWPTSADRLSIERVVYSLFLIPIPDGSALLVGAAWTLSHEFLFYIVFCMLIISPRFGVSAFVLWCAAVIAMIPSQPLNYPWNFLFSTYNLLFAMGMIAALTFKKLPRRGAIFASMFGPIMFLAVGICDAFMIVDISHSVRTISFGVFAAIAVAGLAACERSVPLRVPRSLTFLGDASFSIYLVHGTVLPVAAKGMLFLNMSSVLSPLISLFILVGLGVLAGSLAHIYIERPLLRALR